MTRIQQQFQIFDPQHSMLTFPGDISDKGEIVGRYYRPKGKDDVEIAAFLRQKDGSFQDIQVQPDWGAEA
jgi:hypothetical protein